MLAIQTANIIYLDFGLQTQILQYKSVNNHIPYQQSKAQAS